MFSSWLKFLRLRPVDQRYALLEACLIGVISALAALTLKQGIGWLGGYRVAAVNEHGWFVLPLAGFLFGGLTGVCLQWLAPEAAGGGIPQVKAVLAQLPMSLSLRSALVKLLGTIFILGAGFTLGRRGPTVHIGATLAAQLSLWLPTSPQHRRQLIAAGAAAGLAAGFNTPIAGIVFVVEELMRDISGFTLETAILASFTGAVVSRLLESSEVNLSGLVSQQGWEVTFVSQEIPFFLLLGISAGLLGVIFNRGILFSLRFYQGLSWPIPLRIAVAGLISGSIVAALPPFFRDNAGLRDFLITGEGGWQITAIALIAYFFLTLIAYGSGAPGGLFSPALVIGSALGYLIGVAEVALVGMGSANINTYALAGMGAMFTAVVRVPVTAIVIIFEMTANFELVLPLMISCATAYLVAESLSRGSLYQELLAAKGINLREETQVDPILARVSAEQVMTYPVESLSTDLTLDETSQVFSRSPHRGFPVVEHGKLVGIITQTDLGKIMGRSQPLTLKDIMTQRPVSVSPSAPLQEVLYLLNRYHLSHLPVTKQERLVGIITRSDIIRAEVEALHDSDTLEQPIAQRVIGEPSYTIYQTRSPAVGKGRILLPITNPETVIGLTEFGSAIAQYRQAELELLHLIKVPRNSAPNQAWVNPTLGRQLLQQAEAIANQYALPVHTQLRTTHQRSEAILEVIQERKISLLIMGWKGTKNIFTGRLFGDLTGNMMRKAPCDVVLLKRSRKVTAKDSSASQRWLIPLAVEQTNIKPLMSLLPQLSAVGNAPEYLFCTINATEKENPFQGTVQQLSKQLQAPVQSLTLPTPTTENQVLQLATEKECDVIVLLTTFKATSPSFSLDTSFENNFPAIVAKRFSGTVILIRPARETK
ncbi:Cl- channel voltage-gated family protein [Halothece sp. PCC 7418]|uniref:chloride channel protein n=1 Tax=Halothece sp. (strain PCC 7418) TaxID=65093 RepID=UPI0002A06FD3|nr:chloride channel protein [Halothece sp. PCC 7418]AFZ43783.1 Cl- channel voltage-gated family protein [Halothece sp. PCC 7418]